MKPPSARPSPPEASSDGADATRLSVLTARHVPRFPHSSVNRQDLTIQLGASVLHTSPPAVSEAVLCIIRHPSFNGNMPAEAGSAVPFSQTIRPIPLALAGSSFPLGILCWVTGWGDVRQEDG